MVVVLDVNGRKKQFKHCEEHTTENEEAAPPTSDYAAKGRSITIPYDRVPSHSGNRSNNSAEHDSWQKHELKK